MAMLVPPWYPCLFLFFLHCVLGYGTVTFPLTAMATFHPSMGHCTSEDQKIMINRCEELQVLSSASAEEEEALGKTPLLSSLLLLAAPNFR